MAANDKVLVDSSVWIDFLRGDAATVDAVGVLARMSRIVVCGQVMQEVLQGSRDARGLARLTREMSIWSYEAETPQDFIEAARLFSSLRWEGVTIPPSDCLIAALATRARLALFSHDPDFDAIPDLLRYRP